MSLCRSVTLNLFFGSAESGATRGFSKQTQLSYEHYPMNKMKLIAAMTIMVSVILGTGCSHTKQIGRIGDLEIYKISLRGLDSPNITALATRNVQDNTVSFLDTAHGAGLGPALVSAVGGAGASALNGVSLRPSNTRVNNNSGSSSQTGNTMSGSTSGGGNASAQGGAGGSGGSGQGYGSAGATSSSNSQSGSVANSDSWSGVIGSANNAVSQNQSASSNCSHGSGCTVCKH
jgi:hypothetical protein